LHVFLNCTHTHTHTYIYEIDRQWINVSAWEIAMNEIARAAKNVQYFISHIRNKNILQSIRLITIPLFIFD